MQISALNWDVWCSLFLVEMVLVSVELLIPVVCYEYATVPETQNIDC